MKYLITLSMLVLTGCSIHPNVESSKMGVDAHMHVHSQNIEDDFQFTGGRALFAADSIGLSHAIILSNSYSKNVSIKSCPMGQYHFEGYFF